MNAVGIEVLRRHVFDYVRRAESGESILITVAGRHSALLGPVASRRQWHSARDVAQLFDSPRDVTRAADVAAVADNLEDPWER
ncbi:type II toxin-antitoxin system prevent-host-death family antitoxin [Rhodococcus kroppenstedtii]|uniref:type II toxin-antitoxin system Phd/YefM family antitoxin n=1 Tax=Rhodococcoides kroppenstedtii TaxID=293050 RepID=UPI001C9B560C|nr:type II toxin-antitoxin system prevent-host-death family antitoxin [Rhodococcus kroppenstedtii]MBY6435698.1 type II toxin-antitoxin system prevent-host-death family antitoxin [Rhodococcus kroppenstedtii]